MFDKALMQFPRASNDLLMFAPSIKRMPQLFVFEALSEPARSIRESLPDQTSAFIPQSLSLCSTTTCNTACDLDEC